MCFATDAGVIKNFSPKGVSILRQSIPIPARRFLRGGTSAGLFLLIDHVAIRKWFRVLEMGTLKCDLSQAVTQLGERVFESSHTPPPWNQFMAAAPASVHRPLIPGPSSQPLTILAVDAQLPSRGITQMPHPLLSC